LLTLLAGPPWMGGAVCRSHTNLFFAPSGERTEARQQREEKARRICRECPVLVPCRAYARERREYGFWGGESEEERAAAGYRVRMPVGRIARYPRGEGEPVTAHPLARSQFRPAMLPTAVAQ
jgi:WhiB family redox-sensing transcriptional regulator